ncbi:hypothetical protein PFISCL1PPCAC_17501, partial [Pristionchus fissidentatus]
SSSCVLHHTGSVTEVTNSESRVLSCATGAPIQVGQNSFDHVTCLGDTEWYGSTCVGKVSALTSEISITCPSPCASNCSYSAGAGTAPVSKCIGDAEVISCTTGLLQLTTASTPVSYEKASCLPDGSWIAMNCDG